MLSFLLLVLGSTTTVFRLFRIVRRATGGMGLRMKSAQIHLLDPHEQFKIFHGGRSTPARVSAFEETYGTPDPAPGDAAADVEAAIARALVERDAAVSAPTADATPIASARSFGKRRIS